MWVLAHRRKTFVNWSQCWNLSRYLDKQWWNSKERIWSSVKSFWEKREEINRTGLEFNLLHRTYQTSNRIYQLCFDVLPKPATREAFRCQVDFAWLDSETSGLSTRPVYEGTNSCQSGSCVYYIGRIKEFKQFALPVRLLPYKSLTGQSV